MKAKAIVVHFPVRFARKEFYFLCYIAKEVINVVRPGNKFNEEETSAKEE